MIYAQDLEQADEDKDPFFVRARMVKRPRSNSDCHSNPQDFDVAINRSLTQRRLSQGQNKSLLYQEINTHNHSVYEQFLIIGLPPRYCIKKGVAPQPKILFVYPSTPPLFEGGEYEQITSFSFPNGFKQVPPEKHKIISQFIFRLKESKGSTIYGICTHLSALRMPKMFFFDEVSRQFPFCFCFLTKNPMLAPNFQYLSFLVMWMAQTVRFTPHSEFADNFILGDGNGIPAIPGLVSIPGLLKNPSFKVPRIILQELAFYKAQSLNNTSKQTISVAKNVDVVLPQDDTVQCNLLYPSLNILFSCLSVKNITKLYSSMLLEAHILFISNDLNKLTLSVTSAVELVPPFELNAMIMPVLPRETSYLTFLESPTPFICGILVEDEFTVPPGIVVIDLDNDVIIDNDNYPLYPKDDELCKKLSNLLRDNEPSILVPQKITRNFITKATSTNPKYLEFLRKVGDFTMPRVVINNDPPKYVFTEVVVDQICSIFKSDLTSICESLVWVCLVTDTTNVDTPLTVLNKELFLNSCGEQSLGFFKAFLNTTIFQKFCENKIAEKEAQVANTCKPHLRRKRKSNAQLPNFLLEEMYYANFD